jgi:5'-nucleotidase
MANAPLDLGKARILVTNDDGIDAPGIKLLERIARKIARDVWVVAPESEQSAVSHGLTIRRPLRIRRISPRHFAIDGTPTDCVLLAVQKVMRRHRPTLVLSGVNRGANLGDDVTYSGTVAAAMEACLLGYPAIALSQDFKRRDAVNWTPAERWIECVVRDVAAFGFPPNILYNVNFPDSAKIHGIRVASQGRHKIGDEVVRATDPRGQHYYWIGAMRQTDPGRHGTDLAAVREGYVALTPLHLDLTHGPTLTALAEELA